MITAIKWWHICSVPAQVGAHNKKSPLRQQCDSFMKLDYPIFLPHTNLHVITPLAQTTAAFCLQPAKIRYFCVEITNFPPGNSDSFHFTFVPAHVIKNRHQHVRLNQESWLNVIWPAALAAVVQSTVVVLHNYRRPAHSGFHVWVKGEASPSETASPLLVVYTRSIGCSRVMSKQRWERLRLYKQYAHNGNRKRNRRIIAGLITLLKPGMHHQDGSKQFQASRSFTSEQIKAVKGTYGEGKQQLMVWSIAWSVKHAGSGLLEWTQRSHIVTVYQRWDCWRGEQVNWGVYGPKLPQLAKKDEAPHWGRINQNGAPDLHLNGGFASSGCPDVMAILPVFWDSLSRQFYPGRFALNSGESQTCPDWMWTKARGRSKAGARQDRQIKRPCLNKSKMQSRLLSQLLQRGLSWKHWQAQHKPHTECDLNYSLRMESPRRAVTLKTLTGGKKQTKKLYEMTITVILEYLGEQQIQSEMCPQSNDPRREEE